MARRNWFVPAAGAACLGLIVVTLFLYKGESSPVAVAAPGCDQVSSIQATLAGRGFNPDQYRNGLMVNWTATEANTRGQTAFTSQTPRSAEELVGWLGNGSAESGAALNSVLAQSGVTREVALDKANWLPVQFTVPFQLPGNTGYRNGSVYSAGTRQSAAGDIVWFFTQKTNCGSVPPVVIRAGCGNPQTELPKPMPSPTPRPPTSPTTVPGSVCGYLCKGPDTAPAPCVDNAGVSCTGIPGSGGSPGSGGAISHGPDGYSPTDPPPTTVVPAPTTPTSSVTIPPAPPPTTMITAPPG